MLKFFDAVSKTPVSFLVSLNLAQKQYQDVQTEQLHHHIKISSWSAEKCVKKMKLIGFALHWPCDLRYCEGQRRWYKMVEVNGAYKHGTNDKTGWKVSM